MNNSKLIQLIRESINDYIREIDEAGNIAALEAKMNKTQEAIELREKKMNMDGIDEAYHDMIDKGKMKELSSEVKALKKSLTKYEKQLEKMKNKGKKSEEPKEEKEIVDEVNIDETFPENGPGLEEAGLDESFLHMQKLAGIISEKEYNKKIEEVVVGKEKRELDALVAKIDSEIKPKTRQKAKELGDKGELDYTILWNDLTPKTKIEFEDFVKRVTDEEDFTFDSDSDIVAQIFNQVDGWSLD